MVRGLVLTSCLLFVTACGGNPVGPTAPAPSTTTDAKAPEPAPPAPAPTPAPTPTPAPAPPAPGPAPAPAPITTIPYYAIVSSEYFYDGQQAPFPTGNFTFDWKSDGTIVFGYLTMHVVIPENCDGAHAAVCNAMWPDTTEPGHRATLTLESVDGKNWSWTFTGVQANAIGTAVRR